MAAFQACTSSESVTPKGQTEDSTLIKPPTLTQLQAMRFISIEFQGVDSFSGYNGFQGITPQFFYSGGSLSDTIPNRLIWQSTTFSSNIYLDKGNHDLSNTLITGSISSDNLTIDSFVCSHSTDQGSGDNNSFNYYTFDSKLSGFDIPLSNANDSMITYSITGSSIKKLLPIIQMNGQHHFNNHPGGFDYDVPSDYQSTEWDNISTPPKIIIKFYK